jgi:hypothetical protein
MFRSVQLFTLEAFPGKAAAELCFASHRNLAGAAA